MGEGTTSASGALLCESRPNRGGRGTERRLKVLFYLFFPGSGIGRYTHELLEHFLDVDDIEAELVCLPSYHWRASARYRVHAELREIGHSVAIRRRARFLAGQFANPRRLARRAAESGADVVHLCNINHLTYPLWSRWLGRTSAIVTATAHDVRRAKAMINRRYEDRQLRSFYRRADALFVHSQVQREELVEFAGVPAGRIHIVPHGPYDYGSPSGTAGEIRRRFGWPEDRQVALSFGQVRDEKNLGLLIEALAAYRERLHLVVAGPGNGGGHRGIADYRRQAASLGMEGCVTFLNSYIPDEQVPDLFEACDWVVLPYSRTFTSQSGVLNVAAAHRRPVLASAAGTFAETLERNRIGLLVEPDSKVALAEGIGRMLQRIDAGGDFDFETYLRDYSWEENVRRTADVYRDLSMKTKR
jgi:glycosyltransferase involved in cell wall biosynthesis